MQITINRDGENFGPYSLDEVRDLLANGTLKETDLAHTEGSENWTPVSTLPGLQSPGTPEAKSGQSKEGGPTTFPCSGCGASANRPPLTVAERCVRASDTVSVDVTPIVARDSFTTLPSRRDVIVAAILPRGGPDRRCDFIGG